MALVSLEEVDAKVVAELAKRLQREWAVKRTFAEVESHRYSRARCENRKSLERLGRPRLEVPTESYHYWGRKLGYKCWKDEQFLREYERDNPQCKVTALGTKTQFGFVESSGRSPPKKFVKKYACAQPIS